MKIEVLMAVYNKPEFTQLTLEGYARQTDSNFAIAIADDGSTDDTRALIQSFRNRLAIRHLWHEDLGFRKSLILNQTIASSEADYLVFTDNDCIPDPHFIADHRQVAQPGYFVTGRRVDLGPKASEELLSHRVTTPDSRLWLIRHSLAGQAKRAEKALRPPAWLARLWSRKQIGTLGANMAFWHKDLMAINGFDEDFQGYGMEEVDLEWRILASGIKRKSILGRAGLYHLYHTQREMTPENRTKIEAKMAVGHWFAANGIIKHAGPTETTL